MIELKGITKKYQNDRGLDDINLIIQPGEVVGIFGKNGVGKTTLLKTVMQLLKPDKGEVLVDGKPVKPAVFEKLIYMSEEGTLDPKMTLKEVEEFYSFYYPSFKHDLFQEIKTRLELPDETMVSHMSKGQKAKAEIAVGMAKGGKYLLVDEPFLGNDAFTRKDILTMMAEQMEEDGIIVIATHLMEEIAQFLDRVVFLKDGKIAADCSMDEIRMERMSILEKAQEVYENGE